VTRGRSHQVRLKTRAPCRPDQMIKARKKAILREVTRILEMTDDLKMLARVEQDLSRSKLRIRIEKKLDKKTDCWLWIGRVKDGAGVLKSDGRRNSARRLLYSLEIGEIPRGLKVSNSCGHKLCCRPSHTTFGDAANFWSKVDKWAYCWIWMGNHLANGYGRAWYNGEMQTAHRVSWQISFGSIPEGHYVRRRCNNRACVRPDHLFLDQAIGPYGLKHKIPNTEEAGYIRKFYRESGGSA
jgi:HNH endonuclease